MEEGKKSADQLSYICSTKKGASYAKHKNNTEYQYKYKTKYKYKYNPK